MTYIRTLAHFSLKIWICSNLWHASRRLIHIVSLGCCCFCVCVLLLLLLLLFVPLPVLLSHMYVCQKYLSVCCCCCCYFLFACVMFCCFCVCARQVCYSVVVLLSCVPVLVLAVGCLCTHTLYPVPQGWKQFINCINRVHRYRSIQVITAPVPTTGTGQYRL